MEACPRRSRSPWRPTWRPRRRRPRNSGSILSRKMLRLNKLEVRHVRGIAGTGPDLELAGKNLILLGDNATGKSSYIDALEYLLTRSCSSLDIGRAGVNWQDGGVHILADA